MYEQKQPVPSLHQTSVQTQQTLEIFGNGAELSLIQASLYHAHMKIVRTRTEDIFLDIIKSSKNSDFLVKQTFFLFLWSLTKASSSFLISVSCYSQFRLRFFPFANRSFICDISVCPPAALVNVKNSSFYVLHIHSKVSFSQVLLLLFSSSIIISSSGKYFYVWEMILANKWQLLSQLC